MSESTSPAASISQETAAPEATEGNNETSETTSTAQQSGVPGQLSTAPAKAKAPTPEEKKSNKKTLKLKVDGQEFDEEFDMDNEAELIRHLQLSKVAQKRMNEKSTLEKQMVSFLEMLQTNPEKAMRELGMDPEDFSVKLLQRKIEDEQKSPEQRELDKLKLEIEEIRAAKKREDDDRRNTDLSRLQVEQEKKIEEGMISALEKYSLPNQPLVVKKMAEIMLTALENNIDIDPSDAGSLVKKELESDMRSYVSALPDEALEALVGKDRIGNWRKKQIAAIKKGVTETPNSVRQTGNSVINKDEKKPATKKITMSSFLK